MKKSWATFDPLEQNWKRNPSEIHSAPVLYVLLSSDITNSENGKTLHKICENRKFDLFEAVFSLLLSSPHTQQQRKALSKAGPWLKNENSALMRGSPSRSSVLTPGSFNN